MKSISPLYPLVGVGVVVWQDDRLLLVRRRNPPRANAWALPGGKQQWGETVFDTARREVREECAVEIAPRGIVTVLDAITRDAAGAIDFHYTLIEVVADFVSGEAHAGDDATAVRWATLNEVEHLCDWPEVARVARLSLTVGA